MVGKVKGVVFILTPFILHTYSLYTFLKNWIWWPVMDFVLFSLYYILGLHVYNIVYKIGQIFRNVQTEVLFYDFYLRWVSAKPVFIRNWLLKIGDMVIRKKKKKNGHAGMQTAF